MNRFFLFISLLSACSTTWAQYAERHYIAPAPWQYWSDANEVVISSRESENVDASLFKSDGTFISSFIINAGDHAVSYRFSGSPLAAPRNQVGTTYPDRGLIVEASAPVMVNLRNIASDVAGTNNGNVKGNASLVSIGDQGEGTAFRLGYYRTSFGGINTGNPVYSVMAIENGTAVTLDGTLLETLSAGESRIFNASVGALLEADKPVVVNVGSYGDTPAGCGGNGEDGTITQVPPVEVLGTQYMIVRGDGAVNTSADAPEQTTFIATEANTTVEVAVFDAFGSPVGTPQTYTLTDAGDFETIHNGDAANQYSTSFITSDAPVVVFSGTAVTCETDIAVVLPIGGCSGTDSVVTRRFEDYNDGVLPYFCFIVIESDTEPVLLDGANIETLTGNFRVPIGNTGFYLISFENTEVADVETIVLESEIKFTTSIVQQGAGFSMSGYFSAFNERFPPPEINVTDCIAEISVSELAEPYQWYFNGEPIAGATDETYMPQASGYYSVSGTRPCGQTLQSLETYVIAGVPIDLDLGGDRVFCESPFNLNLSGTPENIEDIEDFLIIRWHQDGILLPQAGSSLQVTEPGVYTVVVSYENYDCETTETITVALADFDVSLGDDSEHCDVQQYTLTPQIESDEGIDPSELLFFWSTDDISESITVTESGSYWVEVSYLGCTRMDEIKVELAQAPEIDLGDDLEICENDHVVLEPRIANFSDPESLTYQWSSSAGEDLGNSRTIEIDKLPYDDGTYYTVEAYEPGAEYCYGEETVFIKYYDNKQCIIPQGISPTATADMNDTFDLQWVRDKSNNQAHIKVYNRYGTLVYEEENYANQWDGHSNDGDLLPVGMYFYRLDTPDEVYTGYVYVNY